MNPLPPGLAVAGFALPHATDSARIVACRLLADPHTRCLYLRCPDGCWRYRTRGSRLEVRPLADGGDPAVLRDYARLPPPCDGAK